MAIEVVADVFVAKPREQVFAAAAGSTAAIARYFVGDPPLIPFIAEATLEGGDPPRVGALRHVRMSDGSKITEKILAFEPPSLHSYEAVEMNPLQRLAATRMVAEWRFEEQPGGTRVVWQYSIHPKPLRGLLARLLGSFLRRAMKRCLDTLAADLR